MSIVKKIGYLGLDNAGKTSIITAITKRFGFEEEVSKLMPTRKIARDAFRFLGVEFVRLDFGGQSQYREEYLKYPSKYISGTDLIYYVIDAQDVYNSFINGATNYMELLSLGSSAVNCILAVSYTHLTLPTN